LNYTKERYGKRSEDEEEVEDDIEMSTVESNNNSIKQRKREKAKQETYYRPERIVKTNEKGEKTSCYYCAKCDVDMTPDMEHCEDCDVCVSDYDHHCVFFSKCIAGGNIICFYASICLLIVNFIMMGVFVVMDASNKTATRSARRNHHVS
jgi:hypothetical protein